MAATAAVGSCAGALAWAPASNKVCLPCQMVFLPPLVRRVTGKSIKNADNAPIWFNVGYVLLSSSDTSFASMCICIILP